VSLVLRWWIECCVNVLLEQDGAVCVVADHSPRCKANTFLMRPFPCILHSGIHETSPRVHDFALENERRARRHPHILKIRDFAQVSPATYKQRLSCFRTLCVYTAHYRPQVVFKLRTIDRTGSCHAACQHRWRRSARDTAKFGRALVLTLSPDTNIRHVVERKENSLNS
jgi:hypothetical protein